MSEDTGVAAEAAGLSSQATEPQGVSALRASIPNAVLGGGLVLAPFIGGILFVGGAEMLPWIAAWALGCASVFGGCYLLMRNL